MPLMDLLVSLSTTLLQLEPFQLRTFWLEGEGRSPISSSHLVLLVGIVAAIVLLRMGRQRRQREGTRAAATANEARENLPLLKEGRNTAVNDPEVSRLFVELQEFAREIEGRIDTKIVYTKRLVADAERVIERLNRSIEEARALGLGQQQPQPQTAGPVGPATPVEPTDPGTPEIAIPRDGVHDRVLALADGGKSVDEVASEVGMPSGEVELILGLHRASRRQR